MIKNYLKVALRNLWKQRVYSIINLVGLAIGMACCLLIVLFVNDELSFDRFHSRSDNIYRAWVLEDYANGESFFNTVTPYPLAKAIENEIPEIQKAVQLSVLTRRVKQLNETYEANIKMVSPGFFDVFSFKVIEGKTNDILKDPSSAIITQSKAKMLYGNEDPLGKDLILTDGRTETVYKIGAVLEDPPINSSITFDILLSDLQLSKFVDAFMLNNWFSISPETYVLLEPGTNPDGLSGQLNAIADRNTNMPEGGSYNIGLQPLTDIHLNIDFPIGIANVSDPKNSYILGSIALFILIIACVNFILLWLSISTLRSKEVGVRKSIGADKIQVIFQFVSEAFIFVLISFILSLVLSQISLPTFNSLASKDLSLTFNLDFLLISMAIIILVTVVAGFYPAYIVSRFSSSYILKGRKIGNSSKDALKRFLVGLQFVLCIGLISATFIMRDQLNFLRNKNLGFNKAQLVSIPLNLPEESLPEMVKKGLELTDKFRNDLGKNKSVESISSASHTFGASGWTELKYNDKEGVNRTINANFVSKTFLETMQIKIVKGRDFNDSPSDQKRAVIINETFAEEFEIEDITGEGIPNSIFQDHEIIGIVEDFHYESLHGKVEPCMLVMNPALLFTNGININFYSNPEPKLLVRLAGETLSKSIKEIQDSWKKIKGDATMKFDFIDTQIDKAYSQEKSLGKIMGIASVLAIAIGSLGLFALSALNIQNRFKEISIRKILGASNHNIISNLLMEYIRMVAVTFIIAVPLTLYFMNNWLANFAYKASVDFGIFLLAGLIALIATLLSLIYNMINASKTQPINHLRND